MNTDNFQGGENFDLHSFLVSAGRSLNLAQRIDRFRQFREESRCHGRLYLRTIASAADREVLVLDPDTSEPRKMLMFGSNNYLGLANHPHVKARAAEALRDWGAGVAGPPLLNGDTRLHRELEERLAAFKHAEAAMLFSAGYGSQSFIAQAICFCW